MVDATLRVGVSAEMGVGCPGAGAGAAAGGCTEICARAGQNAASRASNGRKLRRVGVMVGMR